MNTRPLRKRKRTVEAGDLIRQIQQAQPDQLPDNSLPLIYRFPKEYLGQPDNSEAAEIKHRYVLSHCSAE